MKCIVEAAAAQLAARAGNDAPITAEEMVRLLARIARTGPAAARLRAIELLAPNETQSIHLRGSDCFSLWRKLK
jgi:hypothetical protein